MAKVSGQEWEGAAFDPPPEPPAPKVAGDHLQEVAESVDRALAALQAGHWQADVPELLSHLQAVLPKVRVANEALPRP